MFIIAVLFYSGSAYLLYGLKITPVMLPVNLTEGNKLEVSFVARWSVNYRVHIATHRVLPLQEQNCLLGIETVVPEKCAALPTELNLSWSASNDNVVIATGDSRATNTGYWGPDTGKNLGNIPTIQGKTYKLLVNIEQSSPALQKTTPRLIVEVASKDLRWTYVWIGLLFILATFSFVLASILILVNHSKK